MHKRTTLLAGISGLLVLIAAVLFLFLRYQITKSFPQTSGSLQLRGLTAPVDVARDEFGVPVITAANDHDLMMALGFVQAQDRLWQMDLSRRAGQGRLSELFGTATVPFDRMFRILGLSRIAESVYEHLSDTSRQRLQWYADGVNACIETQRGCYPVEFDMLGYTPEPWLPLHSVLAGRLIGWELNMSWWTDVTLGAVVARVGTEKGYQLYPGYPTDVAPAVPASVWRSYAAATSGYLTTSQSFASVFSPASFMGGSNAWAVAPSRSATGSVLLANDTHLPLSLPSLWYEVQLRSPGGMVRGMSIPGVPGIAAGRNERIAWGLTNVMADEADFYIERIDPSDSTRYLYEGTWRQMSVDQETVTVRGDSAVVVEVRRTHHGPVVTDITTPLTRNVAPFVASMRWAGAEADDQFEAFRLINSASNWEQFASGVQKFRMPGLNFVYGDVDGHIGYYCGARIPIRGSNSGLFPLPGWEQSSEWKSFVPPQQLPHQLDPPEGFIASANNKLTDDDYPYRITDLWEPTSRILRLREVLGARGERFTLQDFERLQNDTYSHFARELYPYLLLAIGDTAMAPPECARAYEYISNWHFRLTADDIATSIAHQFLVRLLANTYRDEMGDSLYHDFLVLYSLPLRLTLQLLRGGSSSWFDDVRTDSVETRDDILRRSMREALDSLRVTRGSDPGAWRWGDIHTVELRHPFGLVKPLNILFNRGPYPFAGASTALISGEFSLNEPFKVLVGPTYRQISDLSNSREMRVVLAGGQCGQVFHRHYDDQVSLWLNGAYRVAGLEPTSGQWERLRLEPKP